MNLKERLETNLKKAYNTGFWDGLSRQDAVAEHLAKASAATIAADLKGMWPVMQMLEITRELMQLQKDYDTNKLGWKTNDGSAEQDYLVRQHKLEERLVGIYEAAIYRFCGVEGGEKKV